MGEIYQGDCLEILKEYPDNHFDLIYLDPPFNTGIDQKRKTLKMQQSVEGREGFSGKKYSVQELANHQYNDYFEDYYGFLFPRLEEIYRVLKSDGTMFVHLDWRETHYVRVFLDNLFGRDNCLNEIIWHWDFGGKPKTKLARKHNNILWYVKDVKKYTFNYKDIDRIPYLAPKLVTPEKVAMGKAITDVWWGTITPTNGGEKTGYPTEKPEWLFERLIRIFSNPGNKILDPFAGSGKIGRVAKRMGREFTLIDSSPSAIETMRSITFKDDTDVSFLPA